MIKNLILRFTQYTVPVWVYSIKLKLKRLPKLIASVPHQVASHRLKTMPVWQPLMNFAQGDENLIWRLIECERQLAPHLSDANLADRALAKWQQDRRDLSP